MDILNTDKISHNIELIKTAFWNLRSKFTLMVILGFLSGFFGGIGIGAIIPLFSLVTKEKSTETDFISKIVERVFSTLHIEYNLLYLLGFMVLIFALKALINYWGFHFNQRTASDYEKAVRTELFEKTVKADWPYLIEQKVGHLESILFQDVYVGSSILTSLSNLIMIFTSLVMYALIAFKISAPITLITFGTGLVFFFVLKPMFYKLRHLSYDLASVSKQVSHHVGEHTIGAKTVKIMGVEDDVVKSGEKYFEKLKQMRVKIDLYNRMPGTFLEPISLLFVAAVLLFYYYYGNSSINIALFAATVYLIQKEFTFMQSFQSTLNNINQSLPQLKIVTDYRQTAAAHEEINSGSEPFKFEGQLELKDISFGYDQKKKILSDLSLRISKGEMVGLIGPSGVGKTTLVDIILGLFPIGSGQILLDGKSMAMINRTDWRKSIGYVSQDTFLLNDTIENNIRFYNQFITKEDIIKSAKIANIYDFIENQPDKFSALVGERGLKLSGGQRQRIILARVLARKPQFLILDEATSALDNESEAMIQESIEKLRGKITALIIAHRLSTITSTDRLLVLNDGKIIEEGKPQELLRDKDSYFYKVYNIREK